MIGNEALANFILDVVRDSPTDEWNEFNGVTFPEGWTYLGSGAFRHAFKGPDGFVYKVHVVAGDRTNEEQYYLWSTVLRNSVLDNARFAAMDYFADSNVQVCEFIEGEHPAWTWDDVSKFARSIREQVGEFLDLNRRNIIVSDGQYVIVDF